MRAGLALFWAAAAVFWDRRAKRGQGCIKLGRSCPFLYPVVTKEGQPFQKLGRSSLLFAHLSQNVARPAQILAGVAPDLGGSCFSLGGTALLLGRSGCTFR